MRTALLFQALIGFLPSTNHVSAHSLYELHRTANRVTVHTTSGPVRGAISNDVASYLGIPYAEPPVGPLRFMPPVKFKGSTFVIDGSSIGPACPANTFFMPTNDLNNYNLKFANLTAQGVATIEDLEQIKATFDEDCLTLNVWVPKGGEKKKAVMVYIYGGAYTSGSTQIGMYDGQNLAKEQDVIVVTLNYRVDILGFAGAPGTTNYNPGFMDQRLAVEWVRDNIHRFGGDIKRTILFGQSAGAASVDHYIYAWHDDPIVSGFLMESGAAGFGEGLPTNNFDKWYKVSAALGCGNASTSNSSAILSCVQSVNITTLLAATGSSAFNPTVDNITGFSDYPALSRAGKFAQLPIVTGNNDFEYGVYIPVFALLGITNPHDYWVGKTNLTYACPAGARANVSVSHNLPTWRYRWFGNFPNTRLMTEPDSGAYHGSEIPFVWDTLPRGDGIPADTDAEVSIRAYIQGAWAAFAKNATGGLSTYGGGWPQYDPFGETLIRLAYDNVTGTNLARPQIYDSTCVVNYPIDLPVGHTK